MNELYHNEIRTQDVINKEVKSSQLEYLGQIKEIVLDKYTGQAHYVVLAFGGFMGFGEDYFAFPWKSISYNQELDCFILNIDKNSLKKEHGFNKDQWPDFKNWTKSLDID